MKIIKSILAVTFLALISSISRGQAPAESKETTSSLIVPAIDQKQLERSEYLTKSDYWRRQVDNNQADQNAWLNWYKASRYTAYTSHSREIGKEKQAELNGILDKMANAIPNTFACNYAKYLNGNKSDESFQYLRLAYESNTGSDELIDDMLCDAVIKKNTEQIKAFSQKLADAEIYNASEVEYNRNVLSSIEQNGILVTYGNVDTYPIILMQQMQQFRLDIEVVCIDWLGSATYRADVASKLNLKNTDKISIEKILHAKTNRPVYLALTVPPESIKKFSNRLYCTGLALKHSTSPLLNLESLAYNWEYLFEKKRINSGDPINRNYLFPMIQLKDYYIQLGKSVESNALQNSILQLSQQLGLSNQLKKHLD